MPLLFIVIAYLIGSIPFGVLISKLWDLDPRQRGSGNIGATNVYRNLGPLAGGVVFILDYLKGYIAVSIGYWAGGIPLIILLAGVAVILGHMFPVFLGFKGGKGVATGLGVLAGIAPEVFIFIVIFSLAMLYLTRYVSLTSIFSVSLATGLMFFFHEPLPYSIGTAIVALLMLLTHLPNLKRLMNGTEPRLGEKR
jgi:glycerol-3-phosphate acyltransferase PlsY